MARRKTTQELGFDELLMEYKVLKRVDESKAKEVFLAVFTERTMDCAKELYGGDVDKLVKVLRKNLVADKRTRVSNPDKYYNGYLPDKAIRMELIDIIDGVLIVEGSSDKPQWKFVEEDLKKINDVKVLKNVIASYASAKSKSIESAMEYYKAETLEEAGERIDDLRQFARARIKELEEPQLSNKLVGKLNKGKAVTLSAKEVEELRKLLG